MSSKLKSYMPTDIGIDLGSMNTRVFEKGKGIVLEVPVVVAVRPDSKCVLAVGDDAKEMLGRAPGNIVAIRLLKGGVIADYDLTEAFFRYVFGKVFTRPWWARCFKPRAVIAVPPGITEVEKCVVETAAHAAGVGDVFLVERSMAAAIGAGLPVSEPKGCMIVDIGASTCDVAIISLTGIVHSCCLPTAGDVLTSSIVDYFNGQNLDIGEHDAEAVKISIGSASPTGSEQSMEVNGRDSETGKPKTQKVTPEEIREVLKKPVSEIVDAVRKTLMRCEPQLFSDLKEGLGIVLSGGGSLLRGLDKILSKEVGMPVCLADNPMAATIEGVGAVLGEIDFLAKNRKMGK